MEITTTPYLRGAGGAHGRSVPEGIAGRGGANVEMKRHGRQEGREGRDEIGTSGWKRFKNGVR